MDKTLFRLMTVLLLLLLLLATVAVAKTILFYRVSQSWDPAVIGRESDLVFTTSKEEQALLSDSGFIKTGETPGFTPVTYTVRHYECSLGINNHGSITTYWWFLDPTVNKIILQPAPVFLNTILTPTLVHPDVLHWWIEDHRTIYDALKQTLGSDQKVHAFAEPCIIKPAAFAF